jgi:hypothetical protein
MLFWKKKNRGEGNKEYNKDIEALLNRIYPEDNGFEEKEMSRIEQALEVRFPEALRNYCLKYGKCAINYTNNCLLIPEEVQTLYRNLEEEYQDDPEDFEDTYGMTLEEMKNKTGDHLIFYRENQGVWQAGIRWDELSQENPKVYYDNAGIDNWTFMSNSVRSFLLSMLWENIRWSGLDFEHYANDTAQIEKVASKNGIELDKLMDSSLDNKFCRTCFDKDTGKLFFFLANRENKLVELIIVTSDLIRALDGKASD